MIPIEKQVASLELSKKLKELGVKQESLFWWVELKDDKWGIVFKTDIGFYFKNGAGYRYKDYGNTSFSAFTVAELGEMLPDCITQFTPQGYKMNRLIKFWKLPYN